MRRKEEGVECGYDSLPAAQESMGRGMEDERIMSTERPRNLAFGLTVPCCCRAQDLTNTSLVVGSIRARRALACSPTTLSPTPIPTYTHGLSRAGRPSVRPKVTQTQVPKLLSLLGMQMETP